MKRDVGLIGPLNVDLLITGQAPVQMDKLTQWAGPSEVVLCAAGSAGYIAQDLAKFGLKTSIISTLADDPFGDAMLRILNEVGLDTTHLTREQNTLSGIGIYMLLFGSKKRPLTYRLPTHQPWPKPFSKEQRTFLLSDHRHLHCAGYLHFPTMWGNEMAALFHDARQKGLSTSLDPQFVLFPVETPWIDPIKELLKFTDLLLLDEDEARQITQEVDLMKGIQFLRSLGPKVVVVKRGAKGSILLDKNTCLDLPAVKTPEDKIFDSIGAGDAFDTGLIYGFLAGWPSDKSQRFATLAAASTLCGSGGTMTLGSITDLQDLLATYQFK
jgi:2-dehydro-3-deoxygluconokinase